MRTAQESGVSLLPGLVVVAVATLVAWVISALVPGLGMLTAAVALGVLAGNVGWLPVSAGAGVAWSSRVLLRWGVVLLGLQLAVGQVLGLGVATLAVVVVAVVVGFAGTVLAGRVLGLSPGLSVLVATGFSICGAAAIAAVEGVVEREDDEVATSVAQVTVFGTVSMVLLPLVAEWFGLSPEVYGRIAGGSVHEVAQVVAAAAPLGAGAVAVAVVVKLSRVVLLAPLVAIMSARRRGSGARPVVVPWFVAGFLGAVVVRSCGLLPEAVLGVGQRVSSLLLAAALFALGTSVRPAALARTGPRALVLGAVSTVLITAVTVAGVVLTG